MTFTSVLALNRTEIGGSKGETIFIGRTPGQVTIW